MNMASLADMTRKLAFLLILASARKNSEVWAFSADVHFGLVARKHKRPSGLLYSSGKLSFLPERFGQKRQNRASQHPNISSGVCCVPLWKAHGLYIQADSVRVDQTFDHSKAYSEGQDEDFPHPTHTNFQARELRAFASSLAFLPTIP